MVRRFNRPKYRDREKIVEKIVEITKEVPVERVAIHEVPREVVRKELFHVPWFTNDESLLGVNKTPDDKKINTPKSDEADLSNDSEDE